MPQKCTVCAHPQHADIDDALANKRSLRSIATQFSLRPSSVHRHNRHHREQYARDWLAGRLTQLLDEIKAEGWWYNVTSDEDELIAMTTVLLSGLQGSLLGFLPPSYMWDHVDETCPYHPQNTPAKGVPLN